ncbi:MAG TPA: hypothetical protein VL728_09730 [Cyclobacteriaceae bacterium]|nr:hypothetical protein [Cyclobacteriaceae bacterium]
MKNIVSILAVVVLALACSTKEKHHEAMKEWKELDSFHKIMAQAFHPLKDSGNVAPAKRLAPELAAEAERWAAASLPEQVNNDEMKSFLEKLKADSRSLADEIAKGATDGVVKEKLTALHDQFHKIMEASKGGHHGEGEEGEDHEHGHEEDEED